MNRMAINCVKPSHPSDYRKSVDGRDEKRITGKKQKIDQDINKLWIGVG